MTTTFLIRDDKPCHLGLIALPENELHLIPEEVRAAAPASMRTYYRVIALQDFFSRGAEIKRDTIGGIVSGFHNLDSESSSLWIGYDASVTGNAIISGNTLVSDRAAVFGKAHVRQSILMDECRVYLNARVEYSAVTGSSRVYSTACVSYSAIQGASRIYSTSDVTNSAVVDSTVCGDSQVYRCQLFRSRVSDNCCLSERHAQDAEFKFEIDPLAASPEPHDMQKFSQLERLPVLTQVLLEKELGI